MKRLFVLFLIILFGFSGLAYGQSLKDVYKSINKAFLAASGSSKRDFDNVVVEARNEFDLFKDTQAAKKNPEFTKHIEAALMAIREAQFAREPMFADPNLYRKSLDKAERELGIAKQYLK